MHSGKLLQKARENLNTSRRYLVECEAYLDQLSYTNDHKLWWPIFFKFAIPMYKAKRHLKLAGKYNRRYYKLMLLEKTDE